MSSDLAGLLAGALFGVITGLLQPRLIATLPEPEPDPEPEEAPGRFSRAPAIDKIPYADLATRPRLALRLALTTAVLGGAVGLHLGWSWDLLVALPMVPVLVALTYVDWHTTYLPTRIIAPSYLLLVLTIVVAGLASGDHDDLLRALIGWAVYGGIFFTFWFFFPGGWGYGDVRLSGLLGLLLGSLGWAEFYVGIMSGILLGGFGGVLLALVRRSLRRRYPYGPFMVTGAFLGILLGHAFAVWRGYTS
jgi:leader peptidase (prepilin peptidase)/N-methyltransferase